MLGPIKNGLYIGGLEIWQPISQKKRHVWGFNLLKMLGNNYFTQRVQNCLQYYVSKYIYAQTHSEYIYQMYAELCILSGSLEVGSTACQIKKTDKIFRVGVAKAALTKNQYISNEKKN